VPRRIAAVQQHEVDQPTILVDGAEQVLPPSSDLYIGFVHPRGTRAVAVIPANAQLRRGHRVSNKVTQFPSWEVQ